LSPIQPKPDQVLAEARKRLDETLALLASLVETNSHAENAEGVAACLAQLEPRLRELGLETEVLEVLMPEPREEGRAPFRRHLLARSPSPKPERPTVLMSFHLDTVFPKDHGFQKLVERSAGRWRGPGVSDMKGGIVTGLLTLALLKQLGALELANWRFLLNTDEELGSPTGMTALGKAADGVDLALCFEAARPCGGLVVARKGMGSGRFVATGRSGHAGIAHDAGVNALTSMARAVVAAEALEARFPGLTVSPGGKVSVRPVALNMIPDHAECEVEWRFESRAVGEAVLAELGRIAEHVGAEAGAPVRFEGALEAPPMEESARTRQVLEAYLGAARDLGMNIQGVATAGVGDMNHVSRMGAICLDGVGPEGGGFHTEDEYLVVDSLARRAAMNVVGLCRYLGERARA
jgi:glutamate carboxypeptidase